jgi:hypothetical protein
MDKDTKEIVLADLACIISAIRRASTGPCLDQEVFWLIRQIVEAGKTQELLGPAYRVAKSAGVFDPHVSPTGTQPAAAAAPHAPEPDPSSPHTASSS